jgi:hypothetical protein
MKKLNPELIESVRVCRKREPWQYRYLAATTKKHWLTRRIKEVPARVWNWANDRVYDLEEFNEKLGDKYYIENETVYERPNVAIKMASGKEHEVWFKTEAEMNDFIKTNLTHVNIKV